MCFLYTVVFLKTYRERKCTMASILSILKFIMNLKGIHVFHSERVTVPVHKYGQIHTQDRIILHGRPYKKLQCLCPHCRKKCVRNGYKHEKDSLWRAPNLNGVPVYISYRPQRILCPEHGAVNEALPWADGNSRFTVDFNNEVAWLVCQMSKSAIAAFLDINWRTVGNCIKAAQERLEPDVTVRLHGLKRICVDETSYRKGHSYITVVYDMDRNRVVWVHEKHGQAVFEEFCKLLTPEERAAIEVVAGDGARWIDSCVKQYFPNATRCVDFFHVVEWTIDALDKVRTSTAAKATREYSRLKMEFKAAEEQAARTAAEASRARQEAEEELAALPKRGRPSKRKRELLAFLKNLANQEILEQEASKPAKRRGRPKAEKFTEEHQKILDDLLNSAQKVKGAKHALGHNPENRTENQEDAIRLIENSYPDLYRAYQMKESLRLILHMKDPVQAAEALTDWINTAGSCGLPPMEELSEKIQRHYDNILNSISCQVNSARSEATNTTIKALIKMARGFRNIENLIALVYLKCSDLVIPLNNRPQPSAEYQAKMRDAANARRRAREEAKRMPQFGA